jgi:uncharacterized protein (AIM24 family)
MNTKVAVSVCAIALMSACVEGKTSSSWGGGGMYFLPAGYTNVRVVGNARAAVAAYGSLTSVSTSAGDYTGSTVATDGTNTVMSSNSGNAETALGTNGTATAIAASTSGASASLVTDGATSSGSTSAGTATSVW